MTLSCARGHNVSGITSADSLLDDLINAQRLDEAIVSDYDSLFGIACSLVDSYRILEGPLVWPVGDAAERLLGAAVILSRGEVRCRGWTDDVTDQRILLVTVAAVTPLGLLTAADHARMLGAVELHARAVAIGHRGFADVETVFESCGLLGQPFHEQFDQQPALTFHPPGF
jgi:hypothetical protein